MFDEREMEEHEKKYQEEMEKMIEENGFFKIPSKEDFKQFKKERQKILGLPVDKYYIENCITDVFVEFFTNIEATKDYHRQFVILTISGYDEDLRELYEIEEVVKWTRKLMLECPQLIYYVNAESSWNFIKSSIAKEIVMLAKTGERMLPKEVAYRQSKGLPVPQYKLKLTVERHVADNILSSIKRLGARIGDIKEASMIANAFIHGFDKE